MPNFYAKQIIEGGTYCVDPVIDLILRDVVGVCKPMKSYNFKVDSDGNPLISECKKHMFSDYYSSPESMTLFRALYKNHFGMADKYAAYWAKVA